MKNWLKLFESENFLSTNPFTYLSFLSALDNGDPLASPCWDLADGVSCVWVVYIDPSGASGHVGVEACLSHLNLDSSISSWARSPILPRDLTSLQVDGFTDQINQLFRRLLCIELALRET